MSRFSENNGFRLLVLLRYLAYGVLLIWALTCLRFGAKNYACYAGFSNTYGRQKVVDINRLQVYVPTVKSDCTYGAKDRYDPKAYVPYTGQAVR